MVSLAGSVPIHRFGDWRLRTKMAVLLVVASLLPLGVATWTTISNAREQLLAQTEGLLAARGDQLVGRIDTFNAGYQRAVNQLAMAPDVLRLVQAPPASMHSLKPAALAALGGWPETDPGVRGVAILDATGTVVVATEAALVGRNMSSRSFVKRALSGVALTSDVYLAEPEVDYEATVAYLAPIWSSGQQVLGVAAIWMRAASLREALRESNGLAGEGSFAVLFDDLGIRISHASIDEMDYHPGIRLAPGTVDALVAEQRFGLRTRALLEDVREVSAHVKSILLDGATPGLLPAYAPGARQWTYIVGRRCATVPWTVFYASPQRTIDAQIARLVREKLVFAAAIMLAALVVGALFAAAILKPIRALSAAAQTIAAGNLNARTAVDGKDELGSLGLVFNNMAGRLQEQAAAVLKESEAQYRKLFETLIEGFCTIEVIHDGSGNPVDFRYLEVNEAYGKHTGLRDVLGKRLRSVVPHPDKSDLQLFNEVLRTGEPLHFNGKVEALGRFLDMNVYRVGGAGGTRIAMVVNDITDQKLAQARLRGQLEQLNLLQQITRAIGERQDLPSIFQVVVCTLEDRLPLDFSCICLYDREPGQLIVSRVGVKSHGLAMELALTEQSRFGIDQNGLSRCVRGQLVYEPDVSDVAHPFPQRLARGGLRAFVAAPLLVDSQVFGVLISARREAGSFSSGDCEFLRQLSEHVALAAHHAQLYTALQAAYVDLRQSQQTTMQQERLRALGQMASGIAHDINNAISPVALYTDSLLERETHLSAQGRGQLQTIQRAIHDVAATVGRMREFYRQREPQLILTQVQLNEIVPQVVELTRATWSTLPQQRGVTVALRTQLGTGLPLIMGAENEIREALTNLVLNAVDAMPQGGTLTIGTRINEQEYVYLEVTDTGVGMDEDARRRCLEPFFTTKGERGTGLGLAMVYGVAQRHSADVEIDSAPGKGTTMRLRFGAVANVVAAVETARVQVMPAPMRLLVVDDDPVLLSSLCETLQSDGHVVVVANGGQAGIDAFRAALAGGLVFDAAMTDLGMPNVDGRQVAAAFKAMSPSTPVIMLTGWGQRLVAEGSVPENVDMLLSKPPKLRELREALFRCQENRAV